MNSDQQKIKSLLGNLIAGQEYALKAATKEQIGIFTERALSNGVHTKVISSLWTFMKSQTFSTMK